MGKRDATATADENQEARPGDRLFVSLPNQAFANLITRLRHKTMLPDSEIIRQALIRLDEEVTSTGGLMVKVATDRS